MVEEGQGQETRMLAIDRLWLSKKKRTTSKQFNQNQKKGSSAVQESFPLGHAS